MNITMVCGGNEGVSLDGYKIVEFYRLINNAANTTAAFSRTSSGTTASTDNFTGNYFSYVYSTSKVTALQDAKFLILTTDKNAPAGEVQILDGKANEVVFEGGTSWSTWFTSINPATNNTVLIAALVKE